MSKNYFGLLDTRNTKFQGSLREDSYSGIGVLIDNIFLTIASTWEKKQIHGPTFIVFPTLEIFYGSVTKECKPMGICCFQSTSQNQRILFKTHQNSKVSIALITEGSSIVHLQNIASNKKQSSKENEQYKLEVKETFSIKKGNEQSASDKFLSKIFGEQIADSHIYAKNYLEENFVHSHDVFQINSCAKEAFFGFKNCESLGFKLEGNSITSIGNYSQFPRRILFGRSIIKNGSTALQIRQGNFDQQKTHTFLLGKAPAEVQHQTEEYFKRSTSFRNEFTALKKIDQLFIWLKALQKAVENESVQKFGQILLQNGNPKDYEIPTKQYTLSEVKEQIDRKARGRQNITNRSSVRSKSPLATNRKHIQSEYIYEEDPIKELPSYRQNFISENKYYEPQTSYEDSSTFRNRERLWDHQNFNKYELAAKVAAQLELQKAEEEIRLRALITEEQLEREILRVKTQNHGLPEESYGKNLPPYSKNTYRYSEKGDSGLRKLSPRRTLKEYNYLEPNLTQQSPVSAGKQNISDVRPIIGQLQPKSSLQRTYSPIRELSKSPYRPRVFEKNKSKRSKESPSKYSYLEKAASDQQRNEALMPEIHLFNLNESPKIEGAARQQYNVKEFNYNGTVERRKRQQQATAKKSKRSFNYLE